MISILIAVIGMFLIQSRIEVLQLVDIYGATGALFMLCFVVWMIENIWSKGDVHNS